MQIKHPARRAHTRLSGQLTFIELLAVNRGCTTCGRTAVFDENTVDAAWHMMKNTNEDRALVKTLSTL